jgi:peptidyl-prolyl cis-trans isomerase C
VRGRPAMASSVTDLPLGRGQAILVAMAARAWFREPLIHFVLLGVVLFGLFRLVAPPPSDTIVVSAETVERLRTQQARRLGREPDPAELDAAIRAWADGELLYREAIALGLDRGDPIVRRRLVQKMQFLFEQREPPAEPTDAELEAWIAEHRDRFEHAPRIGFTHVFVASSSRVTPEAELRAIEQDLLDGADPATLGEAFVLGQVLAAKSAADLNRQFGKSFGDEIMKLPDEGWHRLRSIYGWHLVHVDERMPGRLASVDEVRSQAREGLLEQLREAQSEAALDQLRGRYEIVVEEGT